MSQDRHDRGRKGETRTSEFGDAEDRHVKRCCTVAYMSECSCCFSRPCILRRRTGLLRRAPCVQPVHPDAPDQKGHVCPASLPSAPISLIAIELQQPRAVPHLASDMSNESAAIVPPSPSPSLEEEYGPDLIAGRAGAVSLHTVATIAFADELRDLPFRR